MASRACPSGPGREDRPMEEEPITRYIHPICSAGECARPPLDGDLRDHLGRILEAMACQNQLLIDILGAVNALTAATLNTRNRL